MRTRTSGSSVRRVISRRVSSGKWLIVNRFRTSRVSAIRAEIGWFVMCPLSTLDPDINFDSKFKKLAGKRLIVEAKSVDNEYLRLKETKN